jgi:hypothetical protein
MEENYQNNYVAPVQNNSYQQKSYNAPTKNSQPPKNEFLTEVATDVAVNVV